MKKKAIGIIGGMGPEASARFYRMLIYHAQKDYSICKNEDFPELYLISIPVPDFINSQANEEQALKMLVDRLKRMADLPIRFYCIACNTGHLMLDELRTITDAPFISLLEEVPRFISAEGIRELGILASPTTIKTKMYEGPLGSVGVDLVIPDHKDLSLLGDIIIETIAGENLEKNSKEVEKIADRLVSRGATRILEACTEIPLIFPGNYKVPVFDTLEILAKAVLNKYYLLQ